MDRITRADLELLLAPRRGPCVSLYMPMHPAGRDGLKDPVLLRKLTDEAEARLMDRGLRRPEAQELVAPLRALPDDHAGWQSRGRSLALFSAPNFFKSFRGNGQLETLVHVSDQFTLRPLLPLVSDDDRFFVLAVSQNAVRLWEGDACELQELAVEGLPADLADALKIEDVQRGDQVHSAMRGSLGKQAAVFHGQGGKPETSKENMREFLRQVAAAVDRRLTGEQSPLVLATVGSNVPLWRDVSRYSHLHSDFVAGSPDHLSPHELHAKVWPLVEPALARRQELFRRRMNEADGRRVSCGLKNVVPAAIGGRIDALFLDCTQSRWGRYDAANHAAIVHDQRQPGDQDLVELAAVETLRHSGEVFPLTAATREGAEAAQALLRF
jgi:hypothetical protein